MPFDLAFHLQALREWQETSAQIIDWLDHGHPVLQRMWKRRLVSYASAGLRPRAVAACCMRPSKLASWVQRL